MRNVADLLHSVSAGQDTAHLSAYRNSQCTVYSRMPWAREPSLYVNRYTASRCFVHPVTATDVIYIIQTSEANFYEFN